ncbi:hypothetical protein D9M71_717370 [compost metagenome]
MGQLFERDHRQIAECRLLYVFGIHCECRNLVLRVAAEVKMGKLRNIPSAENDQFLVHFIS